MKRRTLSRADYDKLLELDAAVYPTDQPVTPEILDAWYQRNPEFGIVYEQDGELQGMCITIPLNKDGWQQLTRGEIEESDLDSTTIFDNHKDEAIGLHVYHIEKFTDTPGFYKQALTDLSALVNKLRESNNELEVHGFSGLCVTAQGIGLFANKLNCRERDFINTEHILEKADELLIFDDENEELEARLDDGWEYKNRCKMLITHPGEPSIVWQYL